MNLFRLTSILTALACLLSPTQSQAAEVIEADICVFGGTSAGIVAAIQAHRMGKTAVIVNPTKYLGGLTTGGLGATDIGNKAAVGGISREFYHRIAQHYAKPSSWVSETAQEYFSKRRGGQSAASSLDGPEATMWTFEPRVAEKIYFDMLREAKVPVYLEQRLAAVKKDGLRITEITMENGKVFRAKMFIDGTYEGDLLAKAGCSYHVGREANATYGETLNGIRAETPKHQFTVPVDPYMRPGDPSSGLLPFIQPGDGGKPGDGDKRVQAYNYRLCYTTNAANRLPLAPPPAYDAKKYELLGRYLEALVAAGRKPVLGQFWNPIWMPNHKTDINNNGGFSTDFISMNWDYPEADYAKREQIAKEHENYIRGFMWFLATSPRVPENMREEMKRWGPCKDEFQDTLGWSREMYVREARRLVSDYVMTEKHCRYVEVAQDSVGLAAYNMDSHNCNRIVKNGRAENEGDVQVPPMKPYPISYRSIIPKTSECNNLFVPVCLSSSHIAYGSIRMEPVFMILGQSAATAAVYAIDDKVPVAKVNYDKLRARLLADKQILEWTGPSRTGGRVIDPKSLPGVVLDDADAQKTGDWAPAATIAWKVGSGYLHDGDQNKGAMTVAFTPEIPTAGEYEVFLFAPHSSNRATNVPVTVAVKGGETRTVKVNQRDAKKNGAFSLGKFTLPKGKGTTITVSNKDTEGHVIVDGLQLVPTK
ncbi:MAG: FAD-dependent oxidoreductase [Verrucomicrobiota bacterium]